MPQPLKNQSGYALVLVLMLLTILTILFTVMLRDIQMVRVYAIREVHKVQARLLAESGVAKAEYYLNGNSGHDLLWEGSAEPDSLPLYGSIAMENSRFGLYSRIKSSGTCVRTTCMMTAIAGRTPPKELEPVLTLHGKVGGMALMPGSRIKGTVVLSHGRICRGETTQEAKESGLTVQIKEAKSLPFDSSQAIACIERFAREQAAACSLKSTRGDLSPEKDTTGTIIVNADYRMDKGSYLNKKVVSAGTITLSGDALCTGCSFIANQVLAEGGTSDKCVFYSRKSLNIRGGTHNSQFFGSDSITVSSKASFGPMSLWMLRREGAADSMAAIFFASNSNIQGTIICSSDTAARMHGRLPSIAFGKGCRLNGLCMSDGDIDLNGAEIRGHLWVRSIVTSNDKKAYVNFLFDTKIEKPEIEPVFPLIGTIPAKVALEPITTTFSVRKRTVKDKNVQLVVPPDSSKNAYAGGN